MGAATGLSLWVHLRNILQAGAIWRDEVNSINIASLPTLGQLWSHIRFESFPALWLLVLRFWQSLGLTTDAEMRLLGFLMGVAVVAALWLTALSLGRSLPLFSVALLGFNPAVIQWGDSLRAWGCGAALMLLTLVLIWELVNRPLEPLRIASVLIVAVLSVQCLYYNSVLLFAVCVSGAAVAVRNAEWRKAVTVLAIGAAAAASMLPYLPTIQKVREAQVLFEVPGLRWSWFFGMLAEALATSGKFVLWVWGGLFALAMAAGLLFLWQKSTGISDAGRSAADEARGGQLFCLTALLVGTAGYFVFLKSVGYPTRHWYYVPLMVFAAATIDVAVSVWARHNTVRLARLLLVAGIIIFSFPAAFEAGNVRRTNIDSIAAELSRKATKDDFIVINPWYYGITFQKYFHGNTPWMTVPPINDHAVHRYDLIKEQMMRADQAAPVQPMLEKIAATLRTGHRVWLVGGIDFLKAGEVPPVLPPAPKGPEGWSELPYLESWSMQIGYFIQSRAGRAQAIVVPANAPVMRFENPKLIAVEGWREK